MRFSWATKVQSLEAVGRSLIANRMTIFLSITQTMGVLVFLVCPICHIFMLATL
uniref:Vpe1 n=1 Tax=Arundo donax TaxID=35708 RepID=A0A0A9AA82_ARUDO